MGKRISHDDAQTQNNSGLAVYRLSMNKIYDLGVQSEYTPGSRDYASRRHKQRCEKLFSLFQF